MHLAYDASVGRAEGGTEERPDGSGEHTSRRSGERSAGSVVIDNAKLDGEPNHRPTADEKPAAEPETELMLKADGNTIAERAGQRRRSRRSQRADDDEIAAEPLQKTSRPSAQKGKRKSATKAIATATGTPLKEVNKSTSSEDLDNVSGEKIEKNAGVGQRSASEAITPGSEPVVPKKPRKSSSSSGLDSTGQKDVNQEAKTENQHLPEKEEEGQADTARRTPQRNRKRPKRYDDNAEDLAMGSSKSSTGTVISRRGVAEAR